MQSVNHVSIGNTPLCGWSFKLADNTIVHTVVSKHSSRFSRNSEAGASELLENLEECVFVVDGKITI